ncbi:Nickel uptake substrate-specific transmembrane region [Aliarcobacter thereius]|nr:DUF4198 domain-containing protein [Aliarcobacter thereius]OCL86827.1 Nickel uptake substrate-specific transmembrane region [Aliarcobacter thereius]
MIKKLSLVLVASTVLVVKSFAHDFWVDGYNSSTFKAILGYGHEFPYPEKISKDKLNNFEALVLIDKNMKSNTLKQTGENYQYVYNKSLDDGTYILKGTYKPTFWTKTKDNKWHMGKTKKDLENSQYCEEYSSFAKSIINIGDDNSEIATNIIGQKLEILLLENPSTFKVGTPFKVKILLDGKPAKKIDVKGTFDGFGENKFAFYGTTDLKGEIEITALKAGKWILMVKNKEPYKNDSCDEVVYSSSFTFIIK